jgi:hypothetical protein
MAFCKLVVYSFAPTQMFAFALSQYVLQPPIEGEQYPKQYPICYVTFINATNDAEVLLWMLLPDFLFPKISSRSNSGLNISLKRLLILLGSLFFSMSVLFVGSISELRGFWLSWTWTVVFQNPLK